MKNGTMEESPSWPEVHIPETGRYIAPCTDSLDSGLGNCFCIELPDGGEIHDGLWSMQK